MHRRSIERSVSLPRIAAGPSVRICVAFRHSVSSASEISLPPTLNFEIWCSKMLGEIGMIPTKSLNRRPASGFDIAKMRSRLGLGPKAQKENIDTAERFQFFEIIRSSAFEIVGLGLHRRKTLDLCKKLRRRAVVRNREQSSSRSFIRIGARASCVKTCSRPSSSSISSVASGERIMLVHRLSPAAAKQDDGDVAVFASA